MITESSFSRLAVEGAWDHQQRNRRYKPAPENQGEPRTLEEAHARADAAYKLYGERAPNPRPLEGLNEYRRRVLAVVQPLLPEKALGRNTNLYTQPDQNLGIYEKFYFADAVESLTKPKGELREVVSYDDAGRKLRRFYGDPENAWGPFKAKSQFVTAWNPDGLGRGAKSHTAIKPVQMLMSDGSIREAR